MTETSFPWAYVITNAVWIFGLAVILAALGWHDFLKHKEQRRAQSAASDLNGRSDGLNSPFRRESFRKPVLLGLTLVAGGLALSVSGAILAAGFAAASFGFLYVFVKKFLLSKHD
jgi:hypothetical protein